MKSFCVKVKFGLAPLDLELNVVGSKKRVARIVACNNNIILLVNFNRS